MAAITAAELLFKYSVKTGTAGNSTVGTANGSLGKYISTTGWAGGALNDLFDDVSGAENAASTVDYRCIFLHNSNAANTYENPTVYISAETAGGASIALATDNVATSAIGATAAQAAEIANETTAPVGTSAFSSPTTAATGLALSNIPSGNCKAFWVRRTAANTAALSSDGVTVAVSGDTGSL
jgi:hypothetical protein